MRPTQQIPTDVISLLGAQADTISRKQALGCGLSAKAIRRLLRDERWSRSFNGVYHRGVGAPSFEQRLWAGLLLAGEPCAIGGEAALHRLGVGEEPESITIVVPSARRPRLPLEYDTLRDGQRRLPHARGTLAVIRPEDALLDATRGKSIERFVAACTDLIRLRRTTAPSIEKVLRLRSRQPRRQELLEVLADLQGIESNLEFVFRRDVLRAHGLPEGRRQVKTGQHCRIDLYYDAFGIIVEIDGRLGHVENRFRDFERDNRHSRALQVTFRYGSYDIRANPCAVAAQLGQAFRLAGGDGGHTCDDCAAQIGDTRGP